LSDIPDKELDGNSETSGSVIVERRISRTSIHDRILNKF
jgi:hypothetical protein